MHTIPELKQMFDEAVKTVWTYYGSKLYNDQIMIAVYLQMFNEVPNMITLDSEGLYLNPNLESDDDAVKGYHKNAKYLSVLKTQTSANWVNHFKDKAYILRQYAYPIIIYDKLIIWFDDDAYILCPEPELPKELADLVAVKKEKNDTFEYQYVVLDNNGYTFLNKMTAKKIQMNLADSYNDDLPHDKIKDFIQNDDTGLCILHGKPGTGKTSYIKYLMAEFPDTDFVLMDINILNQMTSSAFINMLDDIPHAVIVIEDCETLLADRLDSRDYKLASFLNITDGLLASSLKLKFICTFNAQINNIDKALLRKGRLKIYYEFKELAAEKATNLMKKLGIADKSETIKNTTLADIYNKHMSTGFKQAEKTKIGFI